MEGWPGLSVCVGVVGTLTRSQVRGGEGGDSPKVLRFSMDINSTFVRKRLLKRFVEKRAKGRDSISL
jgi:hypothetical protein